MRMRAGPLVDTCSTCRAPASNVDGDASAGPSRDSESAMLAKNLEALLGAFMVVSCTRVESMLYKLDDGIVLVKHA
jgi:hypothetical protein